MDMKKHKEGTDTSRSTDTSITTPVTDPSKTSAGSKSLSQSRKSSRISVGRRSVIPEEFYKAKAFLMKNSPISNINLFDHLTDILGKIIEGRPQNVVDYFEEISLLIKKYKLQYKDDAISDKEKPNPILVRAVQEKKLFQTVTEGEEGEEEEIPETNEEDLIIPNLMEIMSFFEQGGIMLNRYELVRLKLALKSLVRSHPLEKLRFWGKIIGTEKNYYIAETVYKEGEEIEEDEEGEEEEDEGEEEEEAHVRNEEEVEEEGEEEEILIRSKFKPPPAIPPEPFRTGLNKNVYFVCNEPGLPWVRLPHVHPSQIVVARQIFKFFTGRLDAPVYTYPPFPGKENNYLRAQIARISSATLISPAGFYRFSDEDEEGAQDNFVENEEFEPIPVNSLIDPSMENWVHQSLYILPQGRCTFFNPKQLEEKEEEEEEEEEEEGPVVEPETGPPLLSSLAEDTVGEGIRVWRSNLSSQMFAQHAIAIVHSNVWPGSHTYAFNKKFENIYIGYGLKLALTVYNPALPSTVMTEYVTGIEHQELIDPSPAEEMAFNEARQEEEEPEDIEEEGEEEET